MELIVKLFAVQYTYPYFSPLFSFLSFTLFCLIIFIVALCCYLLCTNVMFVILRILFLSFCE